MVRQGTTAAATAVTIAATAATPVTVEAAVAV